MADEYLAKRFYVITTSGEVGPVPIADLQGLVNAGRVQPGDTVRSAFGKSLGSVSDVLQGRILSSGSSPGANGDSTREQRRRVSSELMRSTQEQPQSWSSFIWAVGVGTVLLVVLGVIHLIGGRAEVVPVATPTVTDDRSPEVILAWGQQDVQHYEILVRTIAPVPRDIVVRVQGDSPATGVSFDPPGGKVILSAQSTTTSLLLKVADTAPIQAICVRLVPSESYRIGKPEQLDVMVRPPAAQPVPVPVPVPAISPVKTPTESQTKPPAQPPVQPLTAPPVASPSAWAPPSIAWEPFSWTADGKDTGDLGWSEPWYGNMISGRGDIFPPLSAYPGLGTTGYAVIMRDPKQEFLPTGRRMVQACTSGTFWLSVRAQPILASNGMFKRVFLILAQQGTWRYSIVCDRKGSKSSWWSGPTINGQTMDQQTVEHPFEQPVLVVLRLQLNPDGASSQTWIDPPAGIEPVMDPAHSISGMAPFVFDTVKVKAFEDGAMRIADLRIGRTWQEVIPPLAQPPSKILIKPQAVTPLKPPAPSPASSGRSWTPPSIAWEPFSCTVAGKFREGIGWSQDWYGKSFSAEPEPFPTMAAYPGLPPTQGCGIMMYDAQTTSIPTGRYMVGNYTSGTFWISVRVQPILASDGSFGSAYLALADHQAWTYVMSCYKVGKGMRWVSGIANSSGLKPQISASRPLHQPVLMVVRIQLGPSSASTATWFDPPAGYEPVVDSTNSIEGLGPFTFNAVRMQMKKSGGFRIADLRIGRTWQEVVPPLSAGLAGAQLKP